jgi:hypothetical protein
MLCMLPRQLCQLRDSCRVRAITEQLLGGGEVEGRGGEMPEPATAESTEREDYYRRGGEGMKGGGGEVYDG